MPTWPGSLPQLPMVEGNSVTLGDNRLSFKPDVGPPMLRARATKRYDSVNFTFSMTRTQLNAFLAFYETDLVGGTGSFDYDDPTVGSLMTFSFESPPGIRYRNPIYADVSVTLRRG